MSLEEILKCIAGRWAYYGVMELGHRQIWIGFFDMYFDWCSGLGIADLDWLFDMYLF